jgi:hypothetical protein
VILRLGLALAVVVVTLLALAGRIDEGTARLLVIVHAVLAFTGLVVNVASRRRLSRAIGLMKTTVPVVASDPILTPRDDVAALIARVRGLGFDLIGAIDTTLTGGPIRTWIMTAPSGEVWVEIGFAATPIGIFLSEGPNGRFVETAYPRGSSIDVPQLLAGPVSSSPEDALSTQRERLAGVGGPARRVVTMDDYRSAEAAQRAANGGLRIQDHLERVVEPSIRDFAISLVVDTLALAALLVAAPSSGG